MATKPTTPARRTAAARKTLTRSKLRATASPETTELFEDIHLEDVSDADYYKYGTAVIEDRAIFGDDGLKPVARRSLWAAHTMGLHSKAKPDKAAKVVGETLGNYHPHGDDACYNAIVTCAKTPMRMVDGEGNWGTMLDGPAAMRYTNMRLSQYSDLVFFDKFYLPTITYVPNYDGSRKEPLIMPTLLPNSLINGNFGIAPGVNTRSPAYSLKSVFDVARKALAAGACTPEMCMNLVFTTKYGGKVVRSAVNRAERLAFYKTGKGSFRFVSTATEPDRDNAIRLDEWAPLPDLRKTLKIVDAMPGVVETLGDSDKSDKHAVAYKVFFAKSLKGDALLAAIKKVMAKFSCLQRFSVQTTDRFVAKDGTGAAKLRPTTVPELVNKWMADRLELERRACTYWIERRALEIADLNLLRLAVKMRDYIITAIKEKEKLSDDELAGYIAKGLSITVEQANRILDLRIRQLRKLEDQKLVDKINALTAESKTYEGRRKAPKKYVLSSLDTLEAELKKMPRKPVFK
jgi:DNA gyrase/topoisomerase IV subunit A